MIKSICIISLGGSLGCVLRWILAVQFNALFPSIPLGTLAANLGGGYMIGLAIGFFTSHPLVGPEYKLLIITGFLGGLTTFSSFSAEVSLMLQGQRFGWALATISAHVIGSIALTLLGIMTVNYLRA